MKQNKKKNSNNSPSKKSKKYSERKGFKPNAGSTKTRQPYGRGKHQKRPIGNNRLPARRTPPHRQQGKQPIKMRLPAAPPYFARFHPLLSSGILFLERLPFRRSSGNIPYPYPVLRMFFPDHQTQRQSGIAYFPNQKIDIDRSMQFPIRRMVIITFHNSFFPSIIPRLYRKFQPGCSQRQSID